MRDELDILRAEVCYLTESHIAATHLVIPLVVKILPPHIPRYFDFIREEDEVVLIVRAKRGNIEGLRNSNMPYD